MRIAWNHDTKTHDTKVLAGGAALALVCGIMLGGAMRPNLDGDDRPAGPQMIAGWSADRAGGPADPGVATYASASGKVPDYVLGTDWKKAMAWPDERAAVASPARPEPVQAEATADETPQWAAPVTRAAYEPTPPAVHGRYPSLGGETPPAATDESPADSG